jgi:hypothetical protein
VIFGGSGTTGSGGHSDVDVGVGVGDDVRISTGGAGGAVNRQWRIRLLYYGIS